MALTCRYQKQMRRERSDTSAQQFSPLRKVIPDPDAKYWSGPRQRRPCPHGGQIHCWTDTLCRLGTLPTLKPLIRRRVTVKKIALLLLAAASLLSTNVAAQETNAPASKVTKIFDRELPHVPGKSMRAVLVEYGPGAS